MQLDAHNLNVLMNETVRAHIKACGNRIGSVVYYKKDGTIRRLRFQLAAMPARIKGTERGKKASATRARNHPNLLTVYEIGNNFRTVNLDTVLTVKAGGSTTRYRVPRAVAGIPGAFELLPVFRIGCGMVESAA